MKIVQAIPNNDIGGAEVFVAELSNELSRQGHDVILILTGAHGDDYKLQSRLIDSVQLKFIEKKPGFDPLVFKNLNRQIQDIAPDVVHTHLRILNYLIPNILLSNSSIKYFHTVHNQADKEASRFIRFIRKPLFQMNKVMPITISTDSDDSFHQFYNTSKRMLIDNGRSIPTKTKNFAEAQKIVDDIKRTHPGHLIFVNIANVKQSKNHTLINQAFRKVLESKLKAVCIVIGGHSEFPDLVNQLINDAPQNVYYLGKKSNATDYLYFADAFTLSSLFEGAPISLIEAFSLSVPAICTPAGGLKNAIKNGHNGFLSSTFSPDDYYQAIVQYINASDEDKQQMKKASLDTYTQRLSIEKCAQTYVQLFESKV